MFLDIIERANKQAKGMQKKGYEKGGSRITA